MMVIKYSVAVPDILDLIIIPFAPFEMAVECEQEKEFGQDDIENVIKRKLMAHFDQFRQTCELKKRKNRCSTSSMT